MKIAIADIVVWIVLAITIIEAYIIKKLAMNVNNIQSSLKRKVDNINIETKLKDVFTDGGSTEDLYKIASKLLDKVKENFSGINANSYATVIEEIKRSPQLQGELGELLIDFFMKVNRLFYMKDGLSEKEKEQLKKETKVIIKKMQNI